MYGIKLTFDLVTPQHQYASSPYRFLYIFYGTFEENLTYFHELYEFMIIFSIFMTRKFDSEVLLLGEVRCLSPSG